VKPKPVIVPPRSQQEIDYVRERVLLDCLEPQVVAAQMGWPVDQVLQVVEGGVA